MLKRIFDQAVEDGLPVPYASIGVSKKPLYSLGYRDCNGVVLLGAGKAALSHFPKFAEVEHGKEIWFGQYVCHVTKGHSVNYYEIDPAKYLCDLVEKLGEAQGKLKAVVLGGDSEHFKENKQWLIQNKIPVIGEYLDSWKEHCAPEPATQSDKALVVIPSTQEVILYSKITGLTYLSDTRKRSHRQPSGSS